MLNKQARDISIHEDNLRFRNHRKNDEYKGVVMLRVCALSAH